MFKEKKQEEVKPPETSIRVDNYSKTTFTISSPHAFNIKVVYDGDVVIFAEYKDFQVSKKLNPVLTKDNIDLLIQVLTTIKTLMETK